MMRCSEFSVLLLSICLVSSSAGFFLSRHQSPPVGLRRKPCPPQCARFDEDSSLLQSPLGNCNDGLGRCYSDGSETSRRGFLSVVAAGSVTIAAFGTGPPMAGWAAEEAVRPESELSSSSEAPALDPSTGLQRPRAPAAATIQSLLPAVRVRRWIREALSAATALTALDDTGSKGNDSSIPNGGSSSSLETNQSRRREELVEALSALLLPRREFVRNEGEASAARQYQTEPTLEAWNQARRREEETAAAAVNRAFGESGSTRDPLSRFDAEFQAWGARRQFRRLQEQQRALERDDPVRAALNAYTNNLVYGPQYVLTAAPEDRSRLIRQYNGLPDVTAVVRSDLDLRDLYRNQLLTALDDARAEWQYQLSHRTADGAVSATDVLGFLRDAEGACDKWFALVDPQDAELARLTVESEVDS